MFTAKDRKKCYDEFISINAVVNQPYLFEKKTVVVRKYNSKYGDSRVCECGHKYDRHFDTYDDMYPIGCKYCLCTYFVEFIDKEEK